MEERQRHCGRRTCRGARSRLEMLIRAEIRGRIWVAERTGGLQLIVVVGVRS